MRLLLKTPRCFPGAKGVRNGFLLRRARNAYTKILLGAAKPPLRIKVGGLTRPPNHPESRISRNPCCASFSFAKKRGCCSDFSAAAPFEYITRLSENDCVFQLVQPPVSVFQGRDYTLHYSFKPILPHCSSICFLRFVKLSEQLV